MIENELNRWSPLEFRNGTNARNRLVIPPMASQTADHNGHATEATLSHYRRLSLAGAGIVIAEYTFVDPSGRSEEHQLGISSDIHIDGLSALARTIHSSGALAGIQLTHAGGKTERALTDGRLMAPSPISVPVKGRELETPEPMTQIDLEDWKHAFTKAAARAVQSGFDLIELHAAHGYGLNQWLSPLTNARSDEYGRTLDGRMRLLLEIVRTIRLLHPTTLLSVRIPGQDFIEGGITIDSSITLALALEKLGVDVLHISSGIGGWRRPRERRGEGYLVAEAEAIQARLSIPVIGVGGIETGDFIDSGLRKRRFSLAAVGRAILNAPDVWATRHMKGGNTD